MPGSEQWALQSPNPLYFRYTLGPSPGGHVGHEPPCHLKRAAKLEHVCYGIGAEKKTPEKIEVTLFSDYDNSGGSTENLNPLGVRFKLR